MSDLSTSAWADSLQVAFEGLPELAKLQIRDFVSSRLRPREQTEHRGYYIKTLQKAPNYLQILPASGSMKPTPDQLLYIAAKARMQKLEAFEMITRSPINAINVAVQPLVPASSRRQIYVSTLANLKIAMICLIKGSPQWNLDDGNIVIQPFFELVPNLEHLRLNFEEFPGAVTPKPFANEVIRLLAANPALLPRLKNLELGKANLKFAPFLEFLRQHQSLEHLGLHRVVSLLE
jgi:hypothetical protein